MSNLYPIKFNPIFHEKIWGGNRMRTILNKDFGNLPNCGESWELSGVNGNISVVSNGFLAGNDLNELIEIYMGDLVGDKVYEKFGNEFPLLIKFIDAQDDLSIQVHPNDKLSKERHNAYGKTEMWYVAGAEKGALINSGFNQEVDREKYLEYINSGKLTDLLHYDEAEVGDVFFIPAGRVHAIGKGCLVAEIQQTSDVTYRIFDYNRKDDKGNERELHTDLALDAIDFSYSRQYKTDYKTEENKAVEIVSCPYFTTNIIEFNKEQDKDYNQLDSFVIYMTLEGDFEIITEGGSETVAMGETVLLPASLESVQLKPKSESVKILEVYIK
ncbi:mannose-6-phosphate isomerase, type 1 [Draconibacterium orientale]|uniref:Phosphohexomutase n=1 Tax=Draconibacterium orientale TaxID=1168034 RepID=X5DIQ5_9BACT|nr:type I phosphomannose isomerase catalytic subunit [Draconibacterium orientale]AHW60387.1 mannose-6-phosphate isomerase [Draconibacterium orientale]SET80920.1 mannose-6-phosphate isomerase, type 1 [Draconibacterium orientale]